MNTTTVPVKTSRPIKDPVYSDIYNAEVFNEVLNNKVKWCKDLGGWFIFNGRYWEKDSNDRIKKYSIEASDVIAMRMQEIGNKAYPNFKRIQSNQGLTGMIECAKAFMGCNSSDFDSNEYLFNCLNGTYDLYGNNFKKFDSDDLITKTGYVEYSLFAKCPLWDKFLQEIFLGDLEIIDFIQRAIGYSMTSLTTEQCMFILYGHGRNGKSKFIESIVNILGDYALNCPSSTFAIKQGNPIPNDVARLKGSRLVTAIESNQNISLDESMIKQMTGGDRITARFLNKEFFEFTPTFKIFFATNHKPNIRGTDTGIWRRISMIPFNMNITEEQEDKKLGEKLRIEASGIFNWMIEGYRKYSQDGLNVPEKIRKATQIYREEEDDLGQFIKQECVIEKNGVVSSHDFREKFKEVMGYAKGAKILSEYMSIHGFKPNEDNRYLINGKQQRAFIGIRWATQSDRITKQEDLGWNN